MQKILKAQKKMISTSEWQAEHLLACQNTQHQTLLLTFFQISFLPFVTIIIIRNNKNIDSQTTLNCARERERETTLKTFPKKIWGPRIMQFLGS